jgi:hypothetical protein
VSTKELARLHTLSDLYEARIHVDDVAALMGVTHRQVSRLMHDQASSPTSRIEKAERINGTFSRSNFSYDHGQDIYAARAAMS